MGEINVREPIENTGEEGIGEENNVVSPPKTDIEGLNVILNTVKEEFTHIDEQYKNIDSRVSIYLTLQAGLLAFLAQSFHFPDITNISISSKLEFLILAIQYFLPIVVMTLLVISIFLFFKIIGTKNYSRIDMSQFTNMEDSPYLLHTANTIVIYLIDEYAKNALINRKVNETKQKLYRIAVDFTFAAVIALVLNYLFQYAL